MDWIQHVANYLLIGGIIAILLDWINSNNPNPKQRFSNMERIFLIILWPLSVGTFIFHFIKSWFK